MKKRTLLLIPFFVLSSIISCTKQDFECIYVDYNTSFVIEKEHKYCFPNGNSFIVTELKNGFCPCNSICFWEGEMTLEYITQINNTEVEKSVGSSTKTDSVFISEEYIIKFSDIRLKSPCSKTNPSPKISQATIEVKKK